MADILRALMKAACAAVHPARYRGEGILLWDYAVDQRHLEVWHGREGSAGEMDAVYGNECC